MIWPLVLSMNLEIMIEAKNLLIKKTVKTNNSKKKIQQYFHNNRLRLTLEPLCASLPPQDLSPCLLADFHCSDHQQLSSFVLRLQLSSLVLWPAR